LGPFYNGAFSIESKHESDDQFFCSRQYLHVHDGEGELRRQNAPQDIRENRGILNRILLSWTRRTEAYIANDGKHFEQLL
jgi:hypothetical protein